MKDYDQFDRELVYYKDQNEKFVYKHPRHVSPFRKPRIMHLTSNHLKNMLRDKIQLVFIIGFPIIFIFLFSLQAQSISNVKYDLVIINNDIVGFENEDPLTSLYIYNFTASLGFIEALKDEQFRDLFSVTVSNSSLDTEMQRLNREEFHGLLVIEASFSEKIFWEDTNFSGNPQVDIATINDELVSRLVRETTTQIVNSISIKVNGGEAPDLKVQNDVYFGNLTYFDIFLPAILIASILMCISQVATHFAREKEQGTIKRLSTTAVSRSEILISGALAQFIITSFQITLMLTLGMILGAFVNPNANWIVMYMILFLVTFSALGLGLLLASILKSYNQAGVFVWFIILPLQFLGGLFTYGNEFAYSYLFPTYWAAHALRMVMLYGIDSWNVIGFDIIYLITFTLITMIIGVLLFQRKKAI